MVNLSIKVIRMDEGVSILFKLPRIYLPRPKIRWKGSRANMSLRATMMRKMMKGKSSQHLLLKGRLAYLL